MGGGHSPIPPVQNWRIYKVEDAPQLVLVKEALAKVDLKNPWLRNNVWMYTEIENHQKFKNSILRCLFKGFKMGLVAAIATTVAEKVFFSYYNGNDDEHHH